MISIYQLSYWLRSKGYTVQDSDYRAWHGWSWLKVRAPDGGLVVYRNRRP